MARHADAGDRQVQSPRQEQIDHAKTDRVAGSPVNRPVEVTVFGLVIILFVAVETEFGINILIDGRQDLIGFGAEIDPLPQIPGEAVEQGLIRGHVDVRIPRLGQQPRTVLDIQVFTVLAETERQEPIVGRSARQVVDDLLCPPSQYRIAAQHVRMHPGHSGLAKGKDLVAHQMVNGRVLVRQLGIDRQAQNLICQLFGHRQ